jgi:long-chain acyl-CoA synthetase
MVLMRKFVSRQLIELVQKERISVLIGSPFIFRVLAEHVEDPLSFASVRICLSSGAPMPRNLTERFLNEFSLTVRQQYGSSETGTIAIEAEDEALGATVGPPLANVEVKIIGETGAELPAGETGEILVKSATMTNGYVGEHVDNRKFFHQGFFRTRDLGFIDQRGNLVLTGRMKRLINVAGIKVDPVEVENVLKSHPGVKDVSVHAEIGKLEMEVLKATIVALPGSGLSRSKIIKHCRAHLAEFKIPRIIEFKASLPVNLLGKRVLLSR